MVHHPHRHQQGEIQIDFLTQGSSKRRQLLAKLPLQAQDHTCSNSSSSTSTKLSV
jgi:hypothetical protein